MRVKRQKHNRRTVLFYRTCFGFREPFKILCDGTFVHHLLENGITPADTALANIVGAPVKIFTTKCLIAELRSLGESYSNSLNVARCLMTTRTLKNLFFRCDHERRKSAEACVIDVIGENNPERFFVATQDAQLRKNCQEIPGVPVIYALRNALFLERPSTFQREFAKVAEEKRSYMTEWEYKLLKIKEKRVAIEKAGDSADANDHNEDRQLHTRYCKKNNKKNGNVPKDRVQFKRKRAKGPNPLSCKKKIKRENTSAPSGKENKSSEKSPEKSGRKRKRNRKRSRKSSNATE